jgi:hypothetical protein
MTKRELIEILKDFSDDTPVLVHAHSDSGDYNDCYDVELIKVKAYKSYSWRGNYTADISHHDAAEYLHPDVINAIAIY